MFFFHIICLRYNRAEIIGICCSISCVFLLFFCCGFNLHCDDAWIVKRRKDSRKAVFVCVRVLCVCVFFWGVIVAGQSLSSTILS